MSRKTVMLLALAAVGVLAGGAILWAQAHEHAVPKAPAAPMSCCDPNSPMMKQCADGVASAATAIQAAQKALASGDAKTAAAELEKAQKALASIKEGLDKCTVAPAAASVKVVNAQCPIMGTVLAKDKVPADLTREYKGQTVGFCCGGCPEAWDKLTDADKAAKLVKATAPALAPAK